MKFLEMSYVNFFYNISSRLMSEIYVCGGREKKVKYGFTRENIEPTPQPTSHWQQEVTQLCCKMSFLPHRVLFLHRKLLEKINKWQKYTAYNSSPVAFGRAILYISLFPVVRVFQRHHSWQNPNLAISDLS